MIARTDTVLHDAVFAPWERACHSSEYPWRATPELRGEWMKMISSEDEAVSLAGAFGLARSTNLFDDEISAIETYFNNLTELDFSFDALSVALLSGGSPPHIFLQAFISCRLGGESTGMHPFYWGVFSSYVRHPHFSGIGGEVGGDSKNTEPSKIRYMLRCNPLAEPEKVEGLENPWFAALGIFQGAGERGAVGKTEIASIANILRIDRGGTDLKKHIAALCLDPALERDALLHPGLSKGTAPPIHHKDPNKNSIDFFSGSDPVSKVWRFYSPLLIYPWLMEVDQGDETPLTYLGKLLCGNVPAKPYSGKSSNLVARLAKAHPLSYP
jgi:hypothetical protein